MFIEWKSYPTYIEFKSGPCSVVFDTQGNTRLKTSDGFVPHDCLYFKRYGKETMKTIMYRAIPQLNPDAIKNPTEMDIIRLQTWCKDVKRYPAIYKRIYLLLKNYKQELKRLAKGG